MTNKADVLAKNIAEILKNHPSGYSLPQPFYKDKRYFDIEVEQIFCKEWILVGVSCQLPEKGNFFTLDIGDNPITIIRNQHNKIVAFHNTCRHRGSKICLAKSGKVAKLVCPYHQWTYELSGELLYAGSEMGENFNKGHHGLHSIHCRDVGGFIFISLSETPADIDDFFVDLETYLAPCGIHHAKVAAQSQIIEQANWKLVMENNRECYHCAGSHPELVRTILEWDDTRDPRADEAFAQQVAQKQALWDSEGLPHQLKTYGVGARNRLSRVPLVEGTTSMTMDGKAASTKLMGKSKLADLGSLRFLHLPNSWNHAMSDHIICFFVLPISPQQTLLTTLWLVDKDAVEGVDYDVDNLTKVWNATNNQDRKLSEDNQKGINSMAYTPGPYSATYEYGVINFVDWFNATMQQNIALDKK